MIDLRGTGLRWLKDGDVSESVLLRSALVVDLLSLLEAVLILAILPVSQMVHATMVSAVNAEGAAVALGAAEAPGGGHSASR